jgi:hypothetical protein
VPAPAAGHPGQHAGVRAVGADSALRAAAADLPAGARAGAAVVADGAGGVVGVAGRGAGAPGRAAVPEAARPQEGVEDQPAQRGDQAHEPAVRPDAQARVAEQAPAAEDERQGHGHVVDDPATGGGAQPTAQDVAFDNDNHHQEVDVAQQNKRKRELISGPSRDISAEELAVVLPPDKSKFPVDDLVKLYYSCVPDSAGVHLGYDYYDDAAALLTRSRRTCCSISSGAAPEWTTTCYARCRSDVRGKG